MKIAEAQVKLRLSPLTHLRMAVTEAELALRMMKRATTDPAAEIHGNLLVSLGAMRRAAASLEALIAVEEGEDGSTS